jgi:hypothetical protein
VRSAAPFAASLRDTAFSIPSSILTTTGANSKRSNPPTYPRKGILHPEREPKSLVLIQFAQLCRRKLGGQKSGQSPSQRSSSLSINHQRFPKTTISPGWGFRL